MLGLLSDGRRGVGAGIGVAGAVDRLPVGFDPPAVQGADLTVPLALNGCRVEVADVVGAVSLEGGHWVFDGAR